MGLLNELLSYVDSRKRVAKSNIADAYANPQEFVQGLLSPPPEVKAERSRKHRETSRRLESGGGLLGGSVMPGVDRPSDTPEFEAAMNAPMGLLGWTAYHGSPHKFDKFSLDKIGTGEGAQAYGHGLYFADEPEVAKSYADALAPIQGRGFSTWDRAKVEIAGKRAAITTDPQMRAWRSLRAAGDGVPDAFDAAKRIRGDDPQALRWLEKWEKQNARAIEDGGSSLYKVDIDDARAPKESFLDWDKPLSQQPKAAQELLDRVRKEREAAAKAKGHRALQPDDLRTDQQGAPMGGGGSLYHYLSSKRYGGSQEAATRLLQEAGIPGIRYLDAGSRGSGGTYNTVLFDDSLVKILERK